MRRQICLGDEQGRRCIGKVQRQSTRCKRMSMLTSLCTVHRGAGGRGRGLERYGATAAPAATAAEMAWRCKDGEREAAKMALDAVAEPEAVRVAAARTFGRGSGWGWSGQVRGRRGRWQDWGRMRSGGGGGCGAMCVGVGYVATRRGLGLISLCNARNSYAPKLLRMSDPKACKL